MMFRLSTLMPVRSPKARPRSNSLWYNSFYPWWPDYCGATSELPCYEHNRRRRFAVVPIGDWHWRQQAAGRPTVFWSGLENGSEKPRFFFKKNQKSKI